MTIATFLFQKVDPNFAFGKDKKQDDEVIANFKTLGYDVSPCDVAKQHWPQCVSLSLFA